MTMETDEELRQEFVLEAKAHLAAMEEALLRLEKHSADEEAVRVILRGAHSIKGTAGFFSMEALVRVAHSLESFLGALRERQAIVTSPMMDALLSVLDALHKLLQEPPDIVLPPDMEEALKKLHGQLDDEPSLAPFNAAKFAEEKAEAAILGEGPSFLGNTDEYVRVNKRILNDLLALTGEMVLRRNQLLRLSQQRHTTPQLEAVSNGIDELTTQLQKKVLQTRMQPMGGILNKFPRIVRDLSRKLGKEVSLHLAGLEVELDRSMIEALMDPMNHLIRNALDHGIEAPSMRRKLKKSSQASLAIRAYHESERVVIEVSDDGRGISLKRIKETAVQKGFATEKELELLSPGQLLRFVLHPAFSTAQTVTALSGRGVGLDVVKANIEKIGGKIEIESHEGQGTTFRLVLPLTLAIISAFIVLSQGQTFAIPQANVRELVLILPDSGRDKRLEKVNGKPVLRLRGQCMPLLYLRELLGEDNAGETLSADEYMRILVVKAGTQVYALAVDSVYDTEEVLVKSVPEVMKSRKIYSGLTVLGDGNVAMILDAEGLCLEAGLALGEKKLVTAEAFAPELAEQEETYLLLFQCSGPEWLAADLSFVARIEEISPEQLQEVGGKQYALLQGETLRVFQPEEYLPFASRELVQDKLYVIVTKKLHAKVGFLASFIHDAIRLPLVLDEHGVQGSGIIGSAQVDGRIVTVLDLHSLVMYAAPEYNKRIGLPEAVFYKTQDRKARILLAEDSPVFARLVQNCLASAGYTVKIAENGKRAWSYLQEEPFDVLISDMEMPELDGLELIALLRSQERLKDMPAVALTSLADEEHRTQALQAGFDRYLVKLDRRELLETLQELRLESAREVQDGGEA